MFQINNRLMELSQKESALIVHTQDDGKWKRLKNSKYEQLKWIININLSNYKTKLYFSVQIENVTLEVASAILQKQLYNSLVDFDNHLDNLSLDWLNSEFYNCVERTSGNVNVGKRLMINKSVSWQLEWDNGMKQIKFWYLHFIWVLSLFLV